MNEPLVINNIYNLHYRCSEQLLHRLSLLDEPAYTSTKMKTSFSVDLDFKSGFPAIKMICPL